MAKIHEVNFNSSKQPKLKEFLDTFKEKHKNDKHDWFFIRSHNFTDPVQFAIPEHVQLNEINIPEPGKLAIVVGPMKCGNVTLYAINPQGKDIFFDGVLIFHDGLYFSEYDTETERLLTSQSIPDVEHVSKTPYGIRESIQRWIPWSYLAPSFVATVVD